MRSVTGRPLPSKAVADSTTRLAWEGTDGTAVTWPGTALGRAKSRTAPKWASLGNSEPYLKTVWPE